MQLRTANKSSKDALLWVFASHYKWSLLSGVLPRLLFTAFSFGEPFLVERVLNFTQKPPSEDRHKIAYGLIGAYAIVHIGKAVCSTFPLPVVASDADTIQGLLHTL